jgi:hypothetical protein
MLWDALNTTDFQTHCIGVTRTEAPLLDAKEDRAGSDVSVISIAPPPLPTSIAKLLTDRPSEVQQSQVLPI